MGFGGGVMANYFFKCKTCGKLLKSINYYDTEDILKEHLSIHPEVESELEKQQQDYSNEMAVLNLKYSKRMIGRYFEKDLTEEEKATFKRPFLTQEEIIAFLSKGFQVHYCEFGWRNRCIRAELRGKNGGYVPDTKINVSSISALLQKKLIKRDGRQVVLCKS